MNLKDYYLCGIGIDGKVKYYSVGRSTLEDKGWFSFSNGSYNDTELTFEPRGGNSYYVISYIPLSELDNMDLLQ